MSLFSRLVRGSTESTTSADQNGDSGARATQDPASIALAHDDAATRISAIDALGFGDALITLSGLVGSGPPAEAIQRAAQKRLAALIDSGEATFDSIRACSTDSVALLSVAARTADPGLASRLLDEIEDQNSLAQLAIENSSHAIRRLAAERLRDPAIIAQVLKEARGRDNNVYRILKSKRDALHAAERAAMESLKRTADLSITIERHEHQPFTDGYALALDHYAAQWQELQAQAPVELQQRVDAAIERCRQVIALHRQQAARREHEQAVRAAALTEAESERQQVLATLRDLLAGLYDGAIPDVEETLATVRTRWNTACVHAKPAGEEQQRFDRFHHAIVSLAGLSAHSGSVQQQAASLTTEGVGPLKQALAHLTLLGEEVPVAAREASAALQAFEQAQLESQQSKDLLLNQIAALLRKAQNALRAGQSRQAAGMRRSLEQKLRGLPELPPRVLTQLQTFDAQLDLLQDWRSFVVAPKRTELIARMEALVDSDQKPVLLAKQIQQLQDEWKLISKGSTEDTDAEWQLFHDAGQKAYAPCREYFAEQAALRAGNLERRAALLARLQEFAAAQDWQQPDWREVARALRESRQQWRNHQPVERSANRPLQESFEAVSLDLESRLDAEYVRNADAMDVLIKRAQSLQEMADARQAVDEIKRLQAQWKQLGLVPQEQRARLWDDFRQQCDAVYARQRLQRTEQHALLEANARAAAEICAEVERLLTDSGAELIEHTRKLPELRAAFAALGPTGDASRGLRVRFERAVSQFEGRLARQHEDDRARAWERVLDAAGLIRDWRLAVATGAAPETRAELHQSAKAFVSDVPRWPKGVLQTLQAALASEGSSDIAANEAQLRTLCIRTELLTGLPTPAADQDLRRQYQMQQLLKGLGQSHQSAEGGIEALMLEWIAVGATTDAVYGELLPRAPRPSLR